MNKLQNYFRESYDELITKTSWPSANEVQKSTVVVAAASIVVALVIFGMDKSISTVLEFVYDLFS